MKKWFAAVLLAVALLVAPFVVVEACGPNFYPDVFVYQLHPDHPKLYAAGKLGVLLPTYPRADLFVAWRYLAGGQLTSEEQKGYEPAVSTAEIEAGSGTDDADRPSTDAQNAAEPEPADVWLKARNRYATPQAALVTVKQYGMTYSDGMQLSGSYENCQQDAFRVATATLKARVKTWGATSPELAEWIKGQDAVFSHCPGEHAYWLPEGSQHPKVTEPSAVAATAPLLLRQDRAYQKAATLFYTGKHPEALAAFGVIASDKSSPWHGVARYLVARTLVREAFLGAVNGPDDPHTTFNLEMLKQAQTELEAMQQEKLPGVSAHAVRSMLNLVRYRTEPVKRLRELAAAVAGPEPDPDYAQDVTDLTMYENGMLDEKPLRANSNDGLFDVKKPDNDYTPLTDQQKAAGFEKAFHDAAKERGLGEMVDWAISFQSPATAAKQHVLAQWKKTGSLPWLLVALQKASASDAELPALLAAAANVPSSSPAFVTVAYHRIRLLTDAGRMDEARAVLIAAQPAFAASGSTGAMNLLAGQRMQLATTLDAALAEAPRKVLLRSSEERFTVEECLTVMKNPRRKYDCKKITSTTEMDDDAVTVINNQMPLSTLIATTESTKLPAEQRDAVAMMTWTRAVLLSDEAAAAKVFPLLPEKLRQQAGAGVGFHPLMAILRNPGLRPYLNAGTQRARSYDFVESYGDNWWCGDWQTRWTLDTAQQSTTQPLGFLSAETRAAGRNQTDALIKLGGSSEFLTTRVLDYAHAHPNDPDVPEALFLVLRMVRYGCGGGWGPYMNPGAEGRAKRTESMLAEVGHLLRGRYAASPWTKKAAPFGYLTLPNHGQ